MGPAQAQDEVSRSSVRAAVQPVGHHADALRCHLFFVHADRVTALFSSPVVGSVACIAPHQPLEANFHAATGAYASARLDGVLHAASIGCFRVVRALAPSQADVTGDLLAGAAAGPREVGRVGHGGEGGVADVALQSAERGRDGRWRKGQGKLGAGSAEGQAALSVSTRGRPAGERGHGPTPGAFELPFGQVIIVDWCVAGLEQAIFCLRGVCLWLDVRQRTPRRHWGQRGLVEGELREGGEGGAVTVSVYGQGRGTPDIRERFV